VSNACVDAPNDADEPGQISGDCWRSSCKDGALSWDPAIDDVPPDYTMGDCHAWSCALQTVGPCAGPSGGSGATGGSGPSGGSGGTGASGPTGGSGRSPTAPKVTRGHAPSIAPAPTSTATAATRPASTAKAASRPPSTRPTIRRCRPPRARS
jgi:hypothetical protein